jgi:hypothetical protein
VLNYSQNKHWILSQVLDLTFGCSSKLLGALSNIWNNIHMHIKVITSLYKSDTCPILRYAAGNIPDTKKVKELNETERKVLRIIGKT